jgi:YD repeat-containing protein
LTNLIVVLFYLSILVLFAFVANWIYFKDGAELASFYTYDIEGNVDTLLQDYGSSATNVNVMNANNNRWKKIVYQFDLVSGKVNSVAYQPNMSDQFYHKYTYDAENRLVLAETSADSIHWEKEARYQYYKHGPLVRTVIGDQQVQGLDYAYTLHGWLKGVNGSSLAIGYDMGRDGDTTYLNRYVARDAYGYNLGYYTGDYASISSLATPFPGYSALIGTQYKPLYNGNISSMVVNIGKFNNPLMYNYTYDQLNRITQLDVDSGFNQSTNTWNMTPASISDYKERVAYDPNGNILQYLRNGTSTVNLAMDSLSYFYNRDANGRLLNNQLNYIRDEVGGTNENSNYPNDIDDQSANNYAYDSIGNLIKDNAESITNISWSVYGKILEIQRTATGTNPMTDLQYTYDAQGNRISKKVTNSSGPIVYTWYARDAQGNVMSTYTSSGTGAYDSLYSLSLSEQHIYGSTRLGK